METWSAVVGSRNASSGNRSAPRRNAAAGQPQGQGGRLAAKGARVSQEDYRKSRASFVVRTALRDGSLVRPGCCEKCHSIGGRLHAHHVDYLKPLDVQWLCPKCHAAWHREHRALNKQQMLRLAYAELNPKPRRVVPPKEVKPRPVRLKKPQPPKNPAAVALGKMGGKRRAEVLSPERRKAIASKAGKASQAKRKARQGVA